MKKQKTVLVTGFQPFGGHKINPSWVSVEMLPDELEGCKIEKHELPVVWYRAIDELYALIEKYAPDAVMCVGESGQSGEINVERVGVNICIGPDNDGVDLLDAPVFAGGPAAYFSTFPYAAMLNALKAENIASKYSFSAGTYLCNHVLYGALHKAATVRAGMKAGFLHVPKLPQQVIDTGGNCMPIEKTSKGVELCVREICKSL